MLAARQGRLELVVSEVSAWCTVLEGSEHEAREAKKGLWPIPSRCRRGSGRPHAGRSGTSGRGRDKIEHVGHTGTHGTTA